MDTQKDLERVIVRQGERRDCVVISQLIRELAIVAKMEEEVEQSAEDLERDGFDNNPPLFQSLVAEVSDENGGKIVIGYALFCQTYSSWKGKAIHLDDFYVRPNCRESGVGGKIIQELAKIAVKDGFSHIAFECLDWNTNALKFYGKRNATNFTKQHGLLGFRFTGDALVQLATKDRF